MSLSFSKGILIFMMFCILPSPAVCQQEDGMRNIILDSLYVSARRNTSALRQDTKGTVSWDMNTMEYLPKILGNADPMHYTQMLPGIQTNGEYKGGINIQGCENSHNFLSIGGVPIYNVNHLFGLFSTFNASHYSTLSLSRNTASATSPNRLGGTVNMETPVEPADTLGGEIAVGLISSQGTIRIPVAPRTSLTVSLRDSYLNLLYGKWLNQDGEQMKYSFYDANATLVHRINNSHTLQFDSYAGQDNVQYDALAHAKWKNAMAAIHWLYAPGNGFSMKNSLFCTTYSNRVGIDMQSINFKLPSGITEYGMKNAMTWGKWKFGMEASFYDIRQQDAKIAGAFTVNQGDSKPLRTSEYSLYADHTVPLSHTLSLVAGVRGTLYNTDHHTYSSLSPSVELSYDGDIIRASLQCYRKSQFLFQSGFSDMGLPTEFWFSATNERKPQSVSGVSLSCMSYLFDGMFSLSAETYYKRLSNQIEYSGTPFDLMSGTFTLNKALLSGSGTNYGANIMLNKRTGMVTGWISYSYTRAKRHYPSLPERHSYPANHERPHELDALLICHISKKWDVGCTYVIASGTPYTRPNHIYVINKYIVTSYGEHNSSRLSTYSRLDLSCNYKWNIKGRKEHGINLSVYNALFRRNELFYYVSVNEEEGLFAYKPTSFIVNALPSISYYCKF